MLEERLQQTYSRHNISGLSPRAQPQHRPPTTTYPSLPSGDNYYGRTPGPESQASTGPYGGPPQASYQSYYTHPQAYDKMVGGGPLPEPQAQSNPQTPYQHYNEYHMSNPTPPAQQPPESLPAAAQAPPPQSPPPQQQQPQPQQSAPPPSQPSQPPSMGPPSGPPAEASYYQYPTRSQEPAYAYPYTRSAEPQYAPNWQPQAQPPNPPHGYAYPPPTNSGLVGGSTEAPPPPPVVQQEPPKPLEEPSLIDL